MFVIRLMGPLTPSLTDFQPFEFSAGGSLESAYPSLTARPFLIDVPVSSVVRPTATGTGRAVLEIQDPKADLASRDSWVRPDYNVRVLGGAWEG